MCTWMLELPTAESSQIHEKMFRAALSARDVTRLPKSVPRWVFLDWLSRQGWLLHGSNCATIDYFEPRTPNDLSPDAFSKRTAVFAASDGVWAMMYALVDRSRTKRILNMALRLWENGEWSSKRYFLSLAPLDSEVTDGRALFQAGSVYVLPPHGFEQMPAYHWPGLGDVLEPHWANAQPVRPVMRVPVLPTDFPLPVRTHDAVRVDALSQTDPWGFPWLNTTTRQS
jgi:hypothetical protein